MRLILIPLIMWLMFVVFFIIRFISIGDYTNDGLRRIFKEGIVALKWVIIVVLVTVVGASIIFNSLIYLGDIL